MNLVPNAFLLYVTDVQRSTAFYESLFEMKPVFTSPAYVAYQLAGGVTFALWSRHEEPLAKDTVRTSELGLNITRSQNELDALYEEWIGKGAKPVDPPYDDVFGHTFVVSDPDGNLIRVAPAD